MLSWPSPIANVAENERHFEAANLPPCGGDARQGREGVTAVPVVTFCKPLTITNFVTVTFFQWCATCLCGHHEKTPSLLLDLA